MPTILSYLADLRDNNNRDWYHANKERYKTANAEFEALVQKLIYAIGEFDNSVIHNNPKDLTFKLVRDTRFSADKSPYNPAFRAHIASAGKLPIPVGYYISIAPNNHSFLGGGLFAPMFNDATKIIRDYIVEYGGEFEKIINDNEFSKHFKVLGEKLKNVPRDYNSVHPQAEHLKHKSWYVEHPIADSALIDTDAFVRRAAELFCIMKPFNDYLNRALKGIVMPTR